MFVFSHVAHFTPILFASPFCLFPIVLTFLFILLGNSDLFHSNKAFTFSPEFYLDQYVQVQFIYIIQICISVE